MGNSLRMAFSPVRLSLEEMKGSSILCGMGTLLCYTDSTKTISALHMGETPREWKSTGQPRFHRVRLCPLVWAGRSIRDAV